MSYLIKQSGSLLSRSSVMEDLGTIGYEGDSQAHTWQVNVIDGASAISTCICAALFILPNGTKVAVNGSISGQVCTVTFPSSVYSQSGIVQAYMQVFKAQELNVTLASIRFYLNTTGGESVIYVPENTVLPVSELMAKYQECTNAINTFKSQYSSALAISNAFSIGSNKVTLKSGYTFDGIKTFAMDYSLSVQNTGYKWIDGRAIYRKTIDVGAKTGSTVEVDITSLNVDLIISVHGICYGSGNEASYMFLVPGPTTNDYYNIGVDFPSKTKMVIRSVNRKFTAGYVTLEYVVA